MKMEFDKKCVLIPRTADREYSTEADCSLELDNAMMDDFKKASEVFLRCQYWILGALWKKAIVGDKRMGE